MGHGFDPWSGKTPHAEEQLSLCTTTTEPGLQSPGAATTEALSALEAVLLNKRIHRNEKPTPHNWSSACSLQLEKKLWGNEDPAYPRIK